MKRPTKTAKSAVADTGKQPAALTPSPEPTPEQIRKRAQEIYEARGGAPGSELEDWLQAEAELKSALARRGGKKAC